jgi:hypothetical protein
METNLRVTKHKICVRNADKHSGTMGGCIVRSETQEIPSSVLKNYMILALQNSQLMLYREIMAVCSQIHTKHINTLCGQNVELLNVKATLCQPPLST